MLCACLDAVAAISASYMQGSVGVALQCCRPRAGLYGLTTNMQGA